MSRSLILLLCLTAFVCPSHGQANTIDLQTNWLQYEDGKYVPFDADNHAKTLYFPIVTSKYAGAELRIESANPYFIFINGKLSGEYSGAAAFSVDSLASRYGSGQMMLCLYQKRINPRELRTSISVARSLRENIAPVYRPASDFKDFAIVSGLAIIIFFVVITQLNPKLASDYFSVLKIISPREADDAQSNARLTSSNNFQFYIGSSLLLAFYLIVILYHLPEKYALPLQFQASGFWPILWQWARLAVLILCAFLLKIVVVFMLTRLFNMRGLARVHFFNWIRLVLIVFGGGTILLFSYYIMRGQNETIFVAFLSLIIAALIAWIFIVFMKLNGRTEHSMFHLFSYICATELIPLLITIKVLFQ